jgi:hypothetical protein
VIYEALHMAKYQEIANELANPWREVWGRKVMSSLTTAPVCQRALGLV